MSSATPDSIAASWNRTAPHYATYVNRITTMHAESLLPNLPLRTARTVLDIAAGAGSFALAYIRAFPTGIPGQTLIVSDISPRMVEIAEDTVKACTPAGFQTTLRFCVMNACELAEIKDGAVDVAVSVFGLFLVAERSRALGEVRRVLKMGGVLGMAAWAELPEAGSLQKAGFGVPFHKTVCPAFALLPSADERSTEVAKVWANSSTGLAILQDAGFVELGMRKAIHTASFESGEKVWETATCGSLLSDVKEVGDEKKGRVKATLLEACGEGPAYLVAASNLYWGIN